VLDINKISFYFSSWYWSLS